MYKAWSNSVDKSKCVNKPLEPARYKTRVLRAPLQPDPVWRAVGFGFKSTSIRLSTFYREFHPYKWSHWASKLQRLLSFQKWESFWNTLFSQGFLTYKSLGNFPLFDSSLWRSRQGWLKIHCMVKPTCSFEFTLLSRHWTAHSVTGDGWRCWV